MEDALPVRPFGLTAAPPVASTNFLEYEKKTERAEGGAGRPDPWPRGHKHGQRLAQLAPYAGPEALPEAHEGHRARSPLG